MVTMEVFLFSEAKISVAVWHNGCSSYLQLLVFHLLFCFMINFDKPK